MASGMDSASAEYARELTDFRDEKDAFFESSPQSPIMYGERGNRFSGLSYYPPDLGFQVVATLERTDSYETAQIATSTGEMREMARYGVLRFRLADRDLTLSAFVDADDDEPEELFVPFRDATSGKETYGAGRYLDLPFHAHGSGPHEIIMDFNLAYNPYCAYSEAYSCPLPPAENTLPVAITAGEKDYTGHP
jgi:uncharacterized protein (DUF1684 family)